MHNESLHARLAGGKTLYGGCTVIPDAMAAGAHDLRHACLSTWLNGGVAPAQVAEWAGHSVEVLFRVYAKCLEGQEELARAPHRSRAGGSFVVSLGASGVAVVAAALAVMAVLWAPLAPRLIRTRPAADAIAVLRSGRRRGGSRVSIVNPLKHRIT